MSEADGSVIEGGSVRTTGLPVIAPGVLRVDDGRPVLLGGWSPGSGLRHFPRSAVCPFTGADDVEAVDLPTRGTIWLHTTVQAAPPGYGGVVPYDLGVVELEGEPLLRVVARLHGAGIAVGAPVSLVAEEVPGPDGPALTWAFAVTS